MTTIKMLMKFPEDNSLVNSFKIYIVTLPFFLNCSTHLFRTMHFQMMSKVWSCFPLFPAAILCSVALCDWGGPDLVIVMTLSEL